MPRVAVYVKKTLRLDRLTFTQKQMFRLGNVGLASRKGEIERALNGEGAPAKPLSKYYAIYKSRVTKMLGGSGRNRRDLWLTGSMIKEWSVRSVSDRVAVMAWTTRLNRNKAANNERIESFVNWSRLNTQQTTAAANLAVKENAGRLAVEKALGGGR